MQPVTPRDLFSYRFLSHLQYAPGGRRAAFLVAACDEASDGYVASLWLYEDGALRRLADADRGSRFHWVDDARIAIVRTAAHGARCALVHISGAEEPLFDLPFPVTEILALDATHFAAIGAVDAREPSDCKGCAVLDEAPFWSDGCGITNRKRNALFLISTDPLQVRRITEPLEDVNTMTVLGEELVFNACAWTRRAPTNGFRARALNWRTGEVRAVAQDGELWADQLVAVGGEIWLVGSAKRRYGRNENNWYYRLLPDGTAKLFRRDERSSCANLGSDCRLHEGCPRAAKGGALYTLSTRGGNCLLFRVLPGGASELVVDHTGGIDGFAVSEESDEVLLIAMYDTRPQELYSYNLDTRELRRISHFNDAALAGRYVAQPRRMRIESEGCMIEGWVLFPHNYDPHRRYPAILDIHGGPKTAYGPIFVHAMQVWAGMGCFVFYCNPRGSDGGDNQFMDIRGRYGEIDYRNIMDFTDAVLLQYPQIDPARVCVTGGSYGGFMVNWIIGHTDRFCCAASQRSISNWISCYGVSDIGLTFVREETAGTPWTDAEGMWRQSPLRYADRVHTPTLFLHSDHDLRCPMDQGLQMYTALVDHGVPTRMCLFHNECHELSRTGAPSNRLRRLEEIARWFELYAGIAAQGLCP